MTQTELKLGAVLFLAFFVALLTMAAVPTDPQFTTLGGCPPELASGTQAR